MSTPADQFINQNAKWEVVDGKENPDWKEGDVPYATHSGTLELWGLTIRVARLNTGETMIDVDDFHKILAEMEIRL